MSISELFTLEQVASKLSVSPQTLANWIKAGRLRTITLGPRSKRISREELDRFIAAAGAA